MIMQLKYSLAPVEILKYEHRKKLQCWNLQKYKGIEMFFKRLEIGRDC